jgi:hypothetical protein
MAAEHSKKINKQDHRLLAIWASDCADHARYATEYAIKAVAETTDNAAAIERDWQHQHLREHLRSILFSADSKP